MTPEYHDAKWEHWIDLWQIRSKLWRYMTMRALPNLVEDLGHPRLWLIHPSCSWGILVMKAMQYDWTEVPAVEDAGNKNTGTAVGDACRICNKRHRQNQDKDLRQGT